MLFKRYLVHDPLNPVTVLDLFRLSLWKLALFYLFLAALALNLLRSTEGKRLLILLAVTGILVVGVAIYWQGGDIERYLALYPVLFVALGYSLCNKDSHLVPNCVSLVFLVSMAITNLVAMSVPVQHRRQEMVLARVADLTPRLRTSSRVFVVNLQDELYSFTRDFPLDSINRSGTLKVTSLVEVEAKTATQWKQEFAARSLTAWNQGGDVWVTRQVLSMKPRAEWNWVEGDDRRISWSDFYDFFSRLELGDSTGGEDGFVLVKPSERTKLSLDQLSQP